MQHENLVSHGFFAIYDAFREDFFLGSYVDPKRNLLLQKPIFSDVEWEILPYSNDANNLNAFYNTYQNGVKGTLEYCLEQIKDYKIDNNA